MYVCVCVCVRARARACMSVTYKLIPFSVPLYRLPHIFHNAFHLTRC